MTSLVRSTSPDYDNLIEALLGSCYLVQCCQQLAGPPELVSVGERQLDRGLVGQPVAGVAGALVVDSIVDLRGTGISVGIHVVARSHIAVSVRATRKE